MVSQIREGFVGNSTWVCGGKPLGEKGERVVSGPSPAVQCVVEGNEQEAMMWDLQRAEGGCDHE